jgi:hypothetical protein
MFLQMQGLIEAEVRPRSQEITALMDAVLPAAKQAEKRAAGRPNGLTGARLAHG